MSELIQCFMMLLIAILLYEWGRNLAAAGAGLWAAALWLGNPLVVRFGTVAFIDVGLTLFVLAGAYCLFRWAAGGESPRVNDVAITPRLPRPRGPGPARRSP